MLQLALARGARWSEQAMVRGGSVNRQWQPATRPQQAFKRTLADARTPDKTVLPGSQSGSIAGVPLSSILQSSTSGRPSIDDTIPFSEIPKPPPTPGEVNAIPPVGAALPIQTRSPVEAFPPIQTSPPTPAPSIINTSKLPLTGPSPVSTSSNTVPPPPPPPKPRRRRRFRNFLLSVFILTTLGYAGGVYYSLVNDNFHDFFTEYIPFGEDGVAYFEEREFRRRFPSHAYDAKTWPQTRGEQKVTIGRQSGLQPRLAEDSKVGGEELALRGRHVSALEDNEKVKGVDKAKADVKTADVRESVGKKAGGEKADEKKAGKQKTDEKQSDAQKADTKKAAELAKTLDKVDAQPPFDAALTTDKKLDIQPPPNAVLTKEDAKKAVSPPPSSDPAQLLAQSKPATPAPVVPTIDHINVAESTEPAVQELVKMVNDIIIAVNASPEAGKLAPALQNVKAELGNVISSISTLKQQGAAEAETKIQSAHQEFDTAAKELVRRLEQEMREQETKWRDEYETERERLSDSYQQKLAAELDSAQRIADAKTQNALLQQEIALQKNYMSTVQGKIEQERNGRLSKLAELTSSVAELEKLTGEWNRVIDATLQTQHLQVALDAVRTKVLDADHPTPFLHELVALKEVGRDDDLVSAAIASIPPQAYQRGIPTPAHLIDRFRRVAAEVRKASLLPEDAGVASHAASAVLSRFMFSKKSERGLPEGEDVEATLARTEGLLEEGDLDAAAREMNGLKGWAGVLSRDWVGECRRVLEVRQAVEVIGVEARLKSLLVD